MPRTVDEGFRDFLTKPTASDTETASATISIAAGITITTITTIIRECMEVLKSCMSTVLRKSYTSGLNTTNTTATRKVMMTMCSRPNMRAIMTATTPSWEAGLAAGRPAAHAAAFHADRRAAG